MPRCPTTAPLRRNKGPAGPPGNPAGKVGVPDSGLPVRATEGGDGSHAAQPPLQGQPMVRSPLLTGPHGRRARLGRLPSPRVPEAQGTRLTTASRAGGAGSWTPDTRARSVPACLPLDDEPVEGTLPVPLLNRVPAPSGGAVGPYLRICEGLGDWAWHSSRPRCPRGCTTQSGKDQMLCRGGPPTAWLRARAGGAEDRPLPPRRRKQAQVLRAHSRAWGAATGTSRLWHRCGTERPSPGHAPAGPQRCHRALLLPPP